MLRSNVGYFVSIFMEKLREKCKKYRKYTYECKIAGLWRNHSCSGKSISNSYSECVCVCVSLAVVVLHAMRMRHIVSYVACMGLQYFCTLTPKRHDLREIIGGYKMCVLIFSTTFETFLILRRNERDISINIHRYSRKVPVILARF